MKKKNSILLSIIMFFGIFNTLSCSITFYAKYNFIEDVKMTAYSSMPLIESILLNSDETNKISENKNISTNYSTNMSLKYFLNKNVNDLFVGEAKKILNKKNKSNNQKFSYDLLMNSYFSTNGLDPSNSNFFEKILNYKSDDEFEYEILNKNGIDNKLKEKIDLNNNNKRTENDSINKIINLAKGGIQFLFKDGFNLSGFKNIYDFLPSVKETISKAIFDKNENKKSIFDEIINISSNDNILKILNEFTEEIKFSKDEINDTLENALKNKISTTWDNIISQIKLLIFSKMDNKEEYQFDLINLLKNSIKLLKIIQIIFTSVDKFSEKLNYNEMSEFYLFSKTENNNEFIKNIWTSEKHSLSKIYNTDDANKISYLTNNINISAIINKMKNLIFENNNDKNGYEIKKIFATIFTNFKIEKKAKNFSVVTLSFDFSNNFEYTTNPLLEYVYNWISETKKIDGSDASELTYFIYQILNKLKIDAAQLILSIGNDLIITIFKSLIFGFLNDIELSKIYYENNESENKSALRFFFDDFIKNIDNNKDNFKGILPIINVDEKDFEKVIEVYEQIKKVEPLNKIINNLFESIFLTDKNTFLEAFYSIVEIINNNFEGFINIKIPDFIIENIKNIRSIFNIKIDKIISYIKNGDNYKISNNTNYDNMQFLYDLRDYTIAELFIQFENYVNNITSENESNLTIGLSDISKVVNNLLFDKKYSVICNNDIKTNSLISTVLLLISKNKDDEIKPLSYDNNFDTEVKNYLEQKDYFKAAFSLLGLKNLDTNSIKLSEESAFSYILNLFGKDSNGKIIDQSKNNLELLWINGLDSASDIINKSSENWFKDNVEIFYKQENWKMNLVSHSKDFKNINEDKFITYDIKFNYPENNVEIFNYRVELILKKGIHTGWTINKIIKNT